MMPNAIDSDVIILLCLCLYRHLQRKHSEQYKNYMSEGSTGKKDASQGSMMSFIGQSSDASLGPNHPQQIKFKESLVANLVVACGVPMSVLDKPQFRTFINDCNSKLTVPCRQTVTYSLLPKLHESLRTILLTRLQQANHVCMTLDIWTDRSCHSFLAITVHTFLHCTPLSGLLTFTPFRGSHTGVRVAEEIEKTITENHLETKVSYITTDNASNMKRAFDVLRELQDGEVTELDGGDEGVLDDDSLWSDIDNDDSVDINQVIDRHCTLRLACFCHTLQLVIKDGLLKLNTPPVRSLTAKCSKLCNMVHQSALFRGAFESVFGAGRSLPKANDTRWNSTFQHLSSIANLDQSQLVNLFRDQNQSHLIITTKEFAMLHELVDLLQPFAEATELTQGDSYATVSCVVPCVVALDNFLMDLLNGRAVHHVIIARALQESLRRRFRGLFERITILPSQTNLRTSSDDFTYNAMLYLIASFLDANYGLLWLEDHPGLVNTKQCLKDQIIGTIYFVA